MITPNDIHYAETYNKLRDCLLRLCDEVSEADARIAELEATVKEQAERLKQQEKPEVLFEDFGGRYYAYKDVVFVCNVFKSQSGKIIYEAYIDKPTSCNGFAFSAVLDDEDMPRDQFITNWRKVLEAGL